MVESSMVPYLKKISSLNPVKYKVISLKQASVEYSKYVKGFILNFRNIREIEEIKSLSEWLLTEI